MLGKSLQTRDRPETLFRVCRCAREHISCPRHMSMRVSLWAVLMTEPCLSVSLFCRCPIYMSMRVSLWAVPVVDVCLRVSLLCGCPRHLSTQVSLRPVAAAGLCGPGSDVFPCGTAVRGRWTGVAVRGFTSERDPPCSGGKGSPDGAYLSAGPGRELAGWEHRRH